MPIIQNSVAATCLAAPGIFRYGSLPNGNDLAGVTALALLAKKSAITQGLIYINHVSQVYRQFAFYGLVLCGILFLISVSWQALYLGGRAAELNKKIESSLEFSPFKPCLFPCQTSHTRLFPKKHSFSYSYLFAGIPVGWRGSAGSLLSADTESLQDTRRRAAWFHVESADHLERGDSDQGLRGKLDKYLRSQVCRRLISKYKTHS